MTRHSSLHLHPFRETCGVCWAVQEVSFDEPIWLDKRGVGVCFCSHECLDEWVEVMEERREREEEERDSIQAELSWLSV